MTWTPIALSRDVPPATTRAVILDGAELVVWRAEDRTAQIWEDRCPHRGMRLSYGFVRGDRLACLYHGWEYGSNSSCVRIPAHPDLEVPPSIKVKAHRAAETGGMIWVSTSADDGEPPLVLAGRPIASMAIATAPSQLIDLLGTALTSDVQLVEAELDGVRVNVGWHVSRPGTIMVHSVALDPGDVETKVLRALHRLRSDAEKRRAA